MSSDTEQAVAAVVGMDCDYLYFMAFYFPCFFLPRAVQIWVLFLLVATTSIVEVVCDRFHLCITLYNLDTSLLPPTATLHALLLI